ncbi:hypothetical protein [Streptomyces sp. NPDC005784]|uniref:hypothetical protein n=1 Tax=Streptomyces sp. NPDC005784 TaxID=3364731 RepID=UPI0036A56053
MSSELAPIVRAEREGEPRNGGVHGVDVALESGRDARAAQPGHDQIEDVLIVLGHVTLSAGHTGQALTGDQAVHGAEGGEMLSVVRREHVAQLPRSRVDLSDAAEGFSGDVDAASPGRDHTQDRQVLLLQENRRTGGRRRGRGTGRIGRQVVEVFAG